MHRDWKFFIFALTLFIVLFGGAGAWRYHQWKIAHQYGIYIDPSTITSCDLYLSDAGGLCFDLSDGKGHHVKPTKEQWDKLAQWIKEHPAKPAATGKCMDGGEVTTTVSCSVSP